LLAGTEIAQFNLKIAFSGTFSQSAFPSKKSLVTLKVDVVESG
jgi:hypothetical protein